ncbi:MAG TPA: 3-methyl-2-oxobutanoate hydroxymethyltransferase [Victivallales bacterium]|nr:3-methyl-2-oxobutanoate hydroxymethyltransferase [Victivallales bacterium]HRR06854.1 3-methyl-2-oxobutanoate hydroxymethyltransferase [Victivallales bacterium]
MQERKEKIRKPVSSDFIKRKTEGKKIAALSLYDALFAKFAYLAGIDLLLVGDSLGMTVLGMDNTLSVKLEDILRHASAVRRGAPYAYIVADMPFMTYQSSISDAMKNAAKFIQDASCDAVKIEGGKMAVPTIESLVSAGIPVMAHIGLLPQKILILGGYRKIGKTIEEKEELIEDAKAVEKAGAFSVILECVEEELAAKITEVLKIPTIGIGSGKNCDGQIQVAHDILGMNDDFIPKHAKKYINLSEEVKKVFSIYCKEVLENSFL